MKKFIILFLLLCSSMACAASGGQWVQSTISVTGTAAKFAESKSNRVYLMIINKGDQTIYLKADEGADSGEGVPIPAGGNYEPLYPPHNAIYLKSASGTQAAELIEG